MNSETMHMPVEGGELFSDDLDLISPDSDEMPDRNITPVQDQDYQQFLDTIIDAIDAAIVEQHALYITNYQNSKRKPVINPKKSPEIFIYLHANESPHTILATTEQHCLHQNLQHMINQGLLRKLRMKNPLFDVAICSLVTHLREPLPKRTLYSQDYIESRVLLNSLFNQIAKPIQLYICEQAYDRLTLTDADFPKEVKQENSSTQKRKKPTCSLKQPSTKSALQPTKQKYLTLQRS